MLSKRGDICAVLRIPSQQLPETRGFFEAGQVPCLTANRHELLLLTDSSVPRQRCSSSGTDVPAARHRWILPPTRIGSDKSGPASQIRTLRGGVLTPGKPIVGNLLVCCARAASGHAAAVPPSSDMKVRRFTARCFPCFAPKG